MAGVLEQKYVPVTLGGTKYNIFTITNGSFQSSTVPTVVFISGLGPSCLSFCAVMRQLASAGIPSVTYDRPGVGRSYSLDEESDASPPTRLGATMAQDIEPILSAMGASAPYVLIAHSYGGVISRHYLETHAADTLGLVLIDANCEYAADRKLDVMQLESWLSSGAVDFFEASGLNAHHKLLPEEWAEFSFKSNPPEGFKRGQGGAQAEKGGYRESARALIPLKQYERHLLGKKPVSVILAGSGGELEKILDAADRDNSDQFVEFRQSVRKDLAAIDADQERLQRDQLQLAEDGSGRMIAVMESGHYVQLTHPEAVTDEIKWVLAKIEERGILSEWKAN